jgi:hypothetical protein
VKDRYTIEQLGSSDWGIWDDVNEVWAYETGSLDDAEDKLTQLRTA